MSRRRQKTLQLRTQARHLQCSLCQQTTWSAEACCGFTRYITEPVSPWESKLWAWEVLTTCFSIQGSSYSSPPVPATAWWLSLWLYSMCWILLNNTDYQLDWKLSAGVQSGTGTLKTTSSIQTVEQKGWGSAKPDLNTKVFSSESLWILFFQPDQVAQRDLPAFRKLWRSHNQLSSMRHLWDPLATPDPGTRSRG